MTFNDPVEVRRRSWLLPGLVVVAVIAIVAIGYWAATAGPAQSLISPRGSTITEVTGDGNQTTPSFKVREGWAIHWEGKGKSFAFEIKGDRDFGTVIDIDEPGSGVTSPTGAGTFNLVVTADGPWSVTITQGD
jgi:hypothetical protein